MQVTVRQAVGALLANLGFAPRSLLVLSLACAIPCTVLLPLNLFGSDAVQQALAKHFGWWWFPELLSIAGTAAAIIARREWGCVRALVLSGLLCALSAAWHAYELGKGRQMPYLKVSPWLVTWESVLAVVVVVTGTSRQVRAYCTGAP